MPPKKKKALADDEKEPLLDKKQSDAPSINAAADDDGEKSVRCVAMRSLGDAMQMRCNDACVPIHFMHSRIRGPHACVLWLCACQHLHQFCYSRALPVLWSALTESATHTLARSHM
jgi:hypothetical protein